MPIPGDEVSSERIIAPVTVRGNNKSFELIQDLAVVVTAIAANELILCHDISPGSFKQAPYWSSYIFIFVTFIAMTYTSICV